MAEVVLKHKGSYKMKCLVVDDESIAIRGIVNYISKLDFLEVAGSCSSALEAADILKTTEIDLMFLDINMPHLSGLELLESLEKPPLTIITTGLFRVCTRWFPLACGRLFDETYWFSTFLSGCFESTRSVSLAIGVAE